MSDRSLPWWAGLAALLVADTVYGFQQTAITPALPVIEQELDTTREWATWLFSGYFILASVSPVFLGKIADRTGKRRIYLASLVVFVLGSVGAAAAPTITVLVIFRVVQGVGGVVFPLSFAIVRDRVPPDRVDMGIAVLTGGFGLGALGGYAIGGLLTQELSWRWIFIVGAIALALAIAGARIFITADTGQTGRRLDSIGAALFGGAMAALIVALTEGPQRGWASAPVVGLFVLAGLIAAGWVARELHTAEPLMDLRVLASRPVLLTNLASMISGYAAIGSSVLLPFLLAEDGGAGLAIAGLAAGPLLTGIVLIPRALGQAAGGPLTIPLARRIGQVPTFAVGMLLVAAGTLGLALSRSQTWMVLLELALLGIGFGAVVSVSGSVVTRTAHAGETSVATSINSVLRRVGGAIGAQIAVALLASHTLARGAPASSAPAPEAFTIAFGVAAAAACAGAIGTLFIRSRANPAPA